MVKNLPAMQETRVRSQGGEDPMEMEMAMHVSILPGKSHGQRSLASCSSWDCKRVEHSLGTKQQQTNRLYGVKEVFKILFC